MAPRKKKQVRGWGSIAIPIADSSNFLAQQNKLVVSPQEIVQNYAKGARKHCTIVQVNKRAKKSHIQKLFPHMPRAWVLHLLSLSFGFFSFDSAKHQKGFLKALTIRKDLHPALVHTVAVFSSTPEGFRLKD